ncbi:type II secretion system protein [Thiobacillus denitrificans ATCC 25259]|uniref:Type II secretion system protein n=1 Tax=Thiobacillus denitrificans (strain ATCC 25259 / T1) TaxID=292415 RepID=Q3SJB9_THIDA|nr:GspE/PulE family protein [Thiobacillus denitrificans]AAZ97248.1 type II secretion system protein [Thiobacillus denitrificans ATCC 25259]
MSIAQQVAADTAFPISAGQFGAARAEAARSGRPLLNVLDEQLGLPAQDFVRRLAHTVHYPVLDAHALRSLTPAFDLVPYAEAFAHDCLVLRNAGGQLYLVLADPFAPDLVAWAEGRLDRPFTPALVAAADLAALLAHHEDQLRAMDAMVLSETAPDRSAEEIEDLSLKAISEDSSPVVKLVRSTLYDALKSGASDVHLETGATGLAIKYRIDGVLSAVGNAAGQDTAEQVISRIKVLAELDISERRVPQDGRFKVAVRGREVDFRVSIMPSVFGEDAVLRVLDKQTLSDQMQGLRLDSLGFDADSMAMLRRMAREPYGMILVTGPTGSGKTTTLYAALSEVNTGLDKIITIEDPVEYHLPGVLQIPVNEKKGLTFARGLRSVLRHDPDKIMVGEIRDPETAQIAVQSALTGHLVFTTVHANNVFDVLGRFVHMGVDVYSFVAALNGISAQRLVRQICSHCAELYVPSAELLAESRLAADAVAGFDFRIGRGCEHCRGSGYRGRIAIAEILLLNDELRELILERAPIRQLKEAARRNGVRFLRDAALELVRKGQSTLQEINRVTFVA